MPHLRTDQLRPIFRARPRYLRVTAGHPPASRRTAHIPLSPVSTISTPGRTFADVLQRSRFISQTPHPDYLQGAGSILFVSKAGRRADKFKTISRQTRHPAIRTPLCHSAPGTPESSNDPCHCQGTIPRLPLIYEYGCSVLRRTPELSVTHLSVIPFCSSNPPISSSVTEQLRARRGTPGTGRPSVALTNAPCTTICESF